MGTSIHSACLPCQPACIVGLPCLCLPMSALVQLKWIFCELIWTDKSTSLRYLYLEPIRTLLRFIYTSDFRCRFCISLAHSYEQNFFAFFKNMHLPIAKSDSRVNEPLAITRLGNCDIRAKWKISFKNEMKWDKMEHHTLKNANNCMKTNIYSYLETSGGQSSNPYLNVVHFLNTRAD